MKAALTFMLLLPVFGLSQTVHEIPFASGNNTIELTIANNSNISQEQVKVEVETVPSWIRFTSSQQTLAQVGGNEEKTAVFTFSVEKTAPINTEQTLSFIVTGLTGQSWTKTITLTVAPPEQFELYQNYPNPFNPATTISYQLPRDAAVTLKIFNLIGQELHVLSNAERSAGFHQETWDASRHSSGAYIYELLARTNDGKQTVARKRMMVVK